MRKRISFILFFHIVLFVCVLQNSVYAKSVRKTNIKQQKVYSKLFYKTKNYGDCCEEIFFKKQDLPRNILKKDIGLDMNNKHNKDLGIDIVKATIYKGELDENGIICKHKKRCTYECKKKEYPEGEICVHYGTPCLLNEIAGSAAAMCGQAVESQYHCKYRIYPWKNLNKTIKIDNNKIATIDNKIIKMETNLKIEKNTVIECLMKTDSYVFMRDSIIFPTIKIEKCAEDEKYMCCKVIKGKWKADFKFKKEKSYFIKADVEKQIIDDMEQLTIFHILHPIYIAQNMDTKNNNCNRIIDYYNFVDNLEVIGKKVCEQKHTGGQPYKIHIDKLKDRNDKSSLTLEYNICLQMANYFNDSEICKFFNNNVGFWAYVTDSVEDYCNLKK